MNQSYTIIHKDFPIDNCIIKIEKHGKKNHFEFELALNSQINSKNIHFKKLGFSNDFLIESITDKLIVPKNGVNYFKSKAFVDSEKISGKLSEFYTSTINDNEKYFQLISEVTQEHITTIFEGGPYKCGTINYAHGLTTLQIAGYNFDIYRHHIDSKQLLIIESRDKIDLNLFLNISKHLIKGIGLLIGCWYRDEYFVTSSKKPEFDAIDSIYYESLPSSILTELQIINPSEFRHFMREVEKENVGLINNLFPAKILTEITQNLLNKEEFNRSVEIILESSNNISPIIKSCSYHVAIETMIGLIEKENKEFFKPIKNTENLKIIQDELLSVIEENDSIFSKNELKIIKKKIQYLNTPFNVDKIKKTFELLKIQLPERLSNLLANRNKFLHGKTPYPEQEVKEKIVELNMNTIRLHLLNCIIILKFCGYRGHIKNFAGYRVATENYYEKNIKEYEENIYYKI